MHPSILMMYFVFAPGFPGRPDNTNRPAPVIRPGGVPPGPPCARSTSLSVRKLVPPQRAPSHSSDTADMYRHPSYHHLPASGVSSLYKPQDNRVQFDMGNDDSFADSEGHKRIRLASQV